VGSYESDNDTALKEQIWGVHPIAPGRHSGFIHPVMKSLRASQIEMGCRRRFKTLSHEN
jgi:hypothetical protein